MRTAAVRSAEGEQTDGGERRRGEERWREKSVGTGIQLPISWRRQAAVLILPVDGQLPLAATHSFCIVNKQFTGKCQPGDGSGSSLLPHRRPSARSPGE